MDRLKDKDVKNEGVQDEPQVVSAQEEPQVITEFIIHAPTAEDHRDAFIEDYNHCILCGTELEFVHVAHFNHWKVDEEAFCPGCNIRTKKESHSLQ